MTNGHLQIVLLDNTNFGGATWTAYTSSNITANLGTVQGWHTVWVGLSGRPAGSQAAWNAVRLDLDLTAPILTVTNNTSVTIPMIQLQGYANEELAWITYDLNNANGSVSNQPGFMTGAIFDTNSFAYTNDSFQCFDLVLASGANTVTLHASDLAGNSTNCTVTFNLDYSSKPAPVVTLWWPTNGTQISGSSFTWRGTVDDPTVALSAQITDASGDTNVVGGVIERNGNFWVDNLPLAPGTNWLILTATDINNHVTSTNILVVQSSVALNITYMDAITRQSAITVSGTINVTNYTVWVNGVMETNLGWNGAAYSWSANNVPVNGAGSAVIQARAIPNIANDGNGNGTGPGGGGNKSSLSNPGNPPAPDAVDEENDPDKFPALYCGSFFMIWIGVDEQYANPGLILSSSETDTAITDWNNLPGASTTGGATGSNQCTTSYAPNGSVTLQLSTVWESQWDTNGLGTTQVGRSTNAGCGIVTNMGPPSAYLGPITFPGIEGDSIYLEDHLDASPPEVWYSTQGARTQFRLQTGGRSLPVHQSLHAIKAQAYALQPPVYEDIYPDCLDNDIPYSVYIPPDLVTIHGLTQNSDGFVWIVLPDGEDIDVTPKAPGVSFYLCNPLECKYNFVPQCQSPIPTNTIRTNIGVGEYVNLSVVAAGTYYPFSPTLPPDTQWSTTAGSLAYTNWPDNVFTAPSNAANVTITVQLPNGQKLNNNLNVIEPTGVSHVALRMLDYGANTGEYHFGSNQVGAGMVLTVYFGPTNVSFGRLYGLEVGEDATNVWGYYTNSTAEDLSHSENGADEPIPLMSDNSWYHADNQESWDNAWEGGYANPGYGGGYVWRIPGQWTVGDAGQINNFPTNAWWFQSITLSANGDLTVAKFGWSVTRGTNGLYTTNSVGR